MPKTFGTPCICETFPESPKLAFTRGKLLVFVQYCYCINVVQYSCAKELACVISGLYQENYKKFKAHVLISGMKPKTIRKFLGNYLFWA